MTAVTAPIVRPILSGGIVTTVAPIGTLDTVLASTITAWKGLEHAHESPHRHPH